MNGDGTIVLFSSDAVDLTQENSAGVFIRPLDGQLTSHLANGKKGVISSNGSTMAYIVHDDLSGKDNVFVRPVDGSEAAIQADTDPRFSLIHASASPVLSNNGMHTVFSANRWLGNVFNIFSFNRDTGALELVSATPTGGYADGDCDAPAVSLDGRYVVFRSNSSNLVPNSSNGFKQILLWDRTTNDIRLISSTTAGNPVGSDCSMPAISGDGNVIAFSSSDENLVAGDSNNKADTFVYNLTDDVLSLASLNAAGVQADGDCLLSDRPSLSRDGGKIAFSSSATNLVPDDTNGYADVFLKDPATGEITRISLASDGTQSNNGSSFPALSLDGTKASFSSNASNLTTGDFNNVSDIFYHDVSGFYNDPQSQGFMPLGAMYAMGRGFKYERDRYSISPSTLNLALERKLFQTQTRGPEIYVRLYYNADPDSGAGPFGRGWSLGQDWTAHALNNKQIMIKKGTGRTITFTSEIDLIGPTVNGELMGATYPVILKPPQDSQDILELTGGSMGDWFSLKYHEKQTGFSYWFNDDWYTNTEIGLLERIQDKYGNGVWFNHDADNWQTPTKVILSSISVGHDLDPQDNRTINFTYNSEGLCTRIDAPDGDDRFIVLAYENGNLTSLTDMAGYVTTYRYDNDHYMTRKTDENGEASFQYRSRGIGAGKYMSQVVDGGAAVNFTHKGVGEVTNTSPAGRITNITTNNDGKTTRIVDPLGSIRSIGYTGRLPNTFTDANGKTSKASYNDKNLLESLTDAENNTFEYEYDSNGNLTKKTSPDGNWIYTYNDKDQILSATSPLGHITVFTYDKFGQVTQIKDPRGNSIIIAYDNFGNITAITDALGGSTQFSWDALGLRLALMTDAAGKKKSLEFDGNDRLTKVKYDSVSGNPAMEYRHDALHTTAVTDENNHTTSVKRNAIGSITQLTMPLGNKNSYDYDLDNRQIVSLNALDQLTKFVYDDAGHLTAEIDPGSRRIKRGYDGEGNITSFTDQKSYSTRFDYDNNNRLIKTTWPDGSVVTYKRDNMGRVSVLKNGRNQTISYSYDADGRLTSKSFNTGPTYSHTYDAAGNLTQISGAGETTIATYTDRNEVSSIRYPDGQVISFRYDDAGNLASINYPGGTSAIYTYDNFNRTPLPQKVQNGIDQDFMPYQQSTKQVTRMTWAGNAINCTYDNEARLTTIARSNSTASTFDYDVNNRLISIDHHSLGSSFALLKYTVNAADQTVAIDSSHSLIHPVSASDVSASYTTTNEIFKWNDQAYTYDNDGNLLSGGAFSDGGYDLENRLLTISKNGVSYVNTYDGKGNRSVRTSEGQTIRYHYDFDGRLLFESIDSEVTARYFYLGPRLAAMERNGSHFFYHFDRNGNTLSLSDASGKVVTSYAYSVEGMKTTSGKVVDNPFTYVGAYGVIDEGNGLYQMGRRYYDADLGRFLQKDPLGFEGGPNLYTYAANNPVDGIDPEGESFIGVVLFLGALGWGANKLWKVTREAKAKYKAIADSDLPYADKLIWHKKNFIPVTTPIIKNLVKQIKY